MEITPKLSVTEDKIRLLTVKTDMFKTACLTLNVLVPMGEYAAEYAVLSSYLVHSSKKYDSLIKLNSRLEELYGALLSGSISRHGENYRIQLSITCIDDSLTFDGKSVTGASLELLLSLLTKPSADENGFSPEQLSTEIRLTAEDIESEINDKTFICDDSYARDDVCRRNLRTYQKRNSRKREKGHSAIAACRVEIYAEKRHNSAERHRQYFGGRL